MIKAADEVRAPRTDELDVFGLSHQGKVRKENQDRFLLATIHKRVEVVTCNLNDAEALPAGEQRLAYRHDR